jgi:hypothetical protein
VGKAKKQWVKEIKRERDLKGNNTPQHPHMYSKTK